MRATNLTGDSVHSHRNGLDGGDCRCPLCEQPVGSHDRLIELRVIEQERAADIEAGVRLRLSTERDAEIAKIKADAEGAAAKQAELFVKRETALMDQFKRDREAWEKMAKQAAEKAKKEAEKTSAAKVEIMMAGRVTALRESHEKAVNVAVLGERAKHIGEKLALEGQVDEMKRRLQSLTAHQRGEPAEIDLHAALELALPGDKVWRTVKGQKGTDVTVEVVHQGDVVGKIVLDSKNHARWSNKFTSKLRSDQLAEGADFAILSTSVFPKDTAQLHFQDNVIVASPQRVVVLVHLLRRQIIENYRLKLSADARNEKADKLYSFIMSPTCTDLLDKIVQLTTDMADLDRSETATHQKVWSKRADLIRGLQGIHDEFSSAVSAIISGEPR